MTKLLRTIWSALWLVIGVLFAASLTTSYLLFIAFPIGAPMAMAGNEYFFNVWIAFDRLWNAILGGDDLETVSSRLGKSTLHGHPAVFGHIWIDKTIAWMLHQVDKHHCRDAINWNVGRPRQVSV